MDKRVFLDAPQFEDLLYRPPTADDIRALNRYLKENPGTRLRLFHGTNAAHPIMTEGLLPTTRGAGRRLSLQSAAGYVYFSTFPGMAEDFARMGYPGRQTVVYTLTCSPVEMLPDLDQLKNKRYWAESQCGNTIADSLLVGYALRHKGAVPAFRLNLFEEKAKPVAPAPAFGMSMG